MTFTIARLPNTLRQHLDGATVHRILVGESGTDVYRLQADNAPTRYLKIESGTTYPELHREKDRLLWLHGKLPVPEVLYFGKEADTQYLLLSAVDGLDASQLTERHDPLQIITALADGLRQIHAIEYRDCPFDRRLETWIAEAQSRVEHHLVDEDDFDDERQGESAQQLYEQLIRTRPMREDLVFVHGDYCFPNILLDPQTLAISGFIDWGRCGIADRYTDLALAVRSIIRNLSERWITPFFDAYGLEKIDTQKIRFYQLLDEFF